MEFQNSFSSVFGTFIKNPFESPVFSTINLQLFSNPKFEKFKICQISRARSTTPCLSGFGRRRIWVRVPKGRDWSRPHRGRASKRSSTRTAQPARPSPRPSWAFHLGSQAYHRCSSWRWTSESRPTTKPESKSSTRQPIQRCSEEWSEELIWLFCCCWNFRCFNRMIWIVFIRSR